MQFIAKHIFNFLVKPGTVYVKRSIRIASEIRLLCLSKYRVLCYFTKMLLLLQRDAQTMPVTSDLLCIPIVNAV